MGPTAFNEIPSIYADIYFGGKIPANPAIVLLTMAMHIPKNTIIIILITQATYSGRKCTITGRRRDKEALKIKQKKTLVCKGI